MTNEIKRYRRRSDGLNFEALQYTQGVTPGEIASFVLNVDVESRVTIANERILDVVQPLFTEWDHAKGELPLQIIDPVSRLAFRLGTNDWVIRSVHKLSTRPTGYIKGQGPEKLSASLLFVKPDVFQRDYAEISADEQEEIRNSLKDIIFEAMGVDAANAEFRHHDLADSIADKVILAGWTRKVPT